MKPKNTLMEEKLKFPMLRIELDALLQEGGEELYHYLQEHQGIEINCHKNYLIDKGVGNEFFSQEDDYLFLYIKREDLKDEKAFEKMMDEFFHPKFEIMYSYHQLT